MHFALIYRIVASVRYNFFPPSPLFFPYVERSLEFPIELFQGSYRTPFFFLNEARIDRIVSSMNFFFNNKDKSSRFLIKL